MSTDKAQEVHDAVRAAYTDALKASRRSGPSCCCGSSSGPESVPVGTAARSAGYEEAERERFASASQSSFGCGNPLAFEPVGAGQTVLDLGSGAGLDLLIAAERVGPGGRVIGIDMTEAMIEAARENARQAGATQVEVRRGTIEELPVDDASVDWVISNCVINLSPDKPRVFAEIARVLRPGGQFSISDIVAEDLPQFVRDRADVYRACIGGAIGEAEYCAGLREAGLEDVEVSSRIVYDASQLRGMVGAGPPGDADPLSRAIESMVGHVWSARFRGSRPR